MANNYFLKTLFAELIDFLAPLQELGESEEFVIAFLKQLGWTDRVIEVASLSTEVRKISTAISSLNEKLTSIEEIELKDLFDLVENTITLFKEAEGFAVAIKNLSNDIPLDTSQIFVDVLSLLFSDYYILKYPSFSEFLKFIEATKIEYIEDALLNNQNERIRTPFLSRIVDYNAIVSFLENPSAHLSNIYFPESRKTTDDSFLFTDKLFFPLSRLLTSTGAVSVYGIKEEYGFDYGQAGNEILKRAITTTWETSNREWKIGATIIYIPFEENANTQWVILPFGGLDLSTFIAPFKIETEALFNPVGIFVDHNNKIDLGLSQENLNAFIKASIERLTLQDTDDSIVIGGKEGIRLEIPYYSLNGEVKITEGEIDPTLSLEIQPVKIVVASGGADGFIDKFLPKDSVNIETNLTIGYSKRKGIYMGADVGLSFSIPVHKDILGFIYVDSLAFTLILDNSVFEVSFTISGKIELGPFLVSVSDLGFNSSLDWGKEEKNIGVADLSVGPKPPSGLGLSIDTGVVKGGGFIKSYPEKGEYNGVFELTIKETISIKVLGLLNTRMPDGSDGFSLLLIVMAEFTPIQLGFGFTLIGVGGLVGINRTIAMESLRNGVRTGATDNILFPDDPVANAPQIISDLQTIFPVEEGRYTFGLMGKLGYGTPTLISLEIGLIIEVPNPVRLAILGVLKAILPEEKSPVLKLQVNFVGTIDFGQQFITFDASLFDSKLLNWPLSGDMAVRIKGGDDANFVFTIGGFHPDYTPPPLGLPSLRRLTISLLTGKNPRLTMETYFAVTSNTVQFGSRVDFYYKVTKKIYVSGWLGFDALFQFSPFYFRTDFNAGLAVFHRKKSILSIRLTIFLEGPTPWHAKGEASFKVLVFKCKVKFDKTWGKRENKTLPPKEVYPALRTALEHPSNWEPITLPQSRTGVTLRSIEGADKRLIIRPDSTIGILQKVVPLGVKIDKFGQHSPADYDHFELELLDEDDKVISSESLREQFAPSHFFKTNSGNLLSLPNFEKYNAGLKLIADDGSGLKASTFSERDVIYERSVIDSHEDKKKMTFDFGTLKLDARLYNTWVLGGSTARSSLSIGDSIRQQFVADKVELVNEGYEVLDVLTGETQSAGTASTMAKAQEILEATVESRQGTREQFTIIPENEMAF